MVEHMFEGIPKGLAEMPPGPQLAAVLASIDRSQLSGHERVTLLQARARLLAWIDADIYTDMESLVDGEFG